MNIKLNIDEVAMLNTVLDICEESGILKKDFGENPLNKDDEERFLQAFNSLKKKARKMVALSYFGDEED